MRLKLDAATIAALMNSKHYDSVRNAVELRKNQLDSRTDAEDMSIFATRQLTELETTIHKKVEADLTGLLVFPKDFTGSTGAKSFGVRSEEAKGISKQIGNSGKDFPMVELAGDEDLYPSINYGLGYEVTLEEIEEAMFANENVDNRKALQSNRGMEEGVNNCLWKGDGRLPGLFQDKVRKNLTEYTGLGSTKLRDLSVTDAKDAIREMKAEANNVYKGKLPVDTLLLCPLDYEFVTTSEISTTTNKLLATYLMEIGLKNIVMSPELAGAFNNGTKDSIVMFPRTDEVLKAKLPGGLKRGLPTFFDGWSFVNKYIAKCSGLHVYHPSKISYTRS